MTQYHKQIALTYLANTWVKPTNNECNDYSVFADLYEWGLVERKIEYHYRDNNKTIAGCDIYFKYTTL